MKNRSKKIENPTLETLWGLSTGTVFHVKGLPWKVVRRQEGYLHVRPEYVVRRGIARDVGLRISESKPGAKMVNVQFKGSTVDHYVYRVRGFYEALLEMSNSRWSATNVCIALCLPQVHKRGQDLLRKYSGGTL